MLTDHWGNTNYSIIKMAPTDQNCIQTNFNHPLDQVLVDSLFRILNNSLKTFPLVFDIVLLTGISMVALLLGNGKQCSEDRAEQIF